MPNPPDRMLKLQDVIGQPAYFAASGARAGKVRDAWFDEHWTLQGLVLDGWCWRPGRARTVRWDDVLVCGADCVFLRSEESIGVRRLKSLPRSFLGGCVRLKELPVVTAEGEQLGRVSDVYFDPNVGTQVVGFELTDGFVSDLKDGRRWLRAPRDPDVFLLGEDAIVVPPLDEDALERVAASDP
ncbi:PRC-barrel domain-containing protein [Paenibacillus albicereus]|nr:PRC-barrel domain-containing protein [Paenibacillus albicereus]